MNKPTVFPTQHILTVLALTTIAYLLLFAWYSSFKKENALKRAQGEVKSRFLVIWLLLAAFVIRIMISCLVVGHKTDINCFTAWGFSLAEKGFASFYNPSSGMPDYPPGYMYVIGFMAKIASAFGHGIHTADGSFDLVSVALIKLPSIIADLGAAYLIFRLASKKYSFSASYLLMAIVAFSPLMIYISSGWGQIDQILSVLILLAIIALNSNKPILGGVLFGFAILMKPQALMAGPLMAMAYIFYVFDKDYFKVLGVECKDNLQKRLGKTIIAVLAACLMIIIAAIPFSTQEFPWYKLIVQKYLGTATSYKFASVNAYNVFALFGKNWKSIDAKSALGLSYGALGTIGMVVSVVFGGVLYFFGRKKNPSALQLSLAYTFVALFMLGHYMHERYLFPMLLLLLAAYIGCGDRKLLYYFLGFSITTMLNCLCSFYYSEYHQYSLYWDDRLVFWCSLVNLILFVLFTITCIRILIAGKVSHDVFESGKPAEEPAENENALKDGATE